MRQAEIVPLHSSLGNKSETPSQKKKERKEISLVQLFDYFGNILSKMNEWNVSLQGKNSKYLSPMIRFKLSGKNSNFRKLVSITVNLTVF